MRDVRAIHTAYYLGVAGETASYLDLEHSLGAHLPAVLAVVVGATLIVLFLMTGSVVLPIKAVLMNALNLSAVFGVLVLIFQDGNLQGLLGYHSVGALDATQPIFLFAVGFGLATDYGVFLLARIKEAYDAARQTRRQSRWGWNGAGASSPALPCCSRSPSGRSRPRRSCSSKSSGSAPRSPYCSTPQSLGFTGPVADGTAGIRQLVGLLSFCGAPVRTDRAPGDRAASDVIDRCQSR